MTVKKEIGLGATLSIGTSEGSSTFTVVAGLISLPGPDGTADDIDTSTIDNATFFKTFQRGQVDPGEMSLVMGYGSTDASQQQMVTAYKTGEVRSWKVTPPTTANSEEFNAYVKGMGRAIEKDSFITRPATLKVSGDPGFLST